MSEKFRKIAASVLAFAMMADVTIPSAQTIFAAEEEQPVSVTNDDQQDPEVDAETIQAESDEPVDEDYLRGDVNLDGKVTQIDATIILREALSVSVSGESVLDDLISEEGKQKYPETYIEMSHRNGDVDNSDNGTKFIQTDATYILRDLLELSISGESTISDSTWNRNIEYIEEENDMAAQDINAFVHIKDENGNVNNIYPATKIENVEGLQTALNAKANSSDVTSGLAGKVDKVEGKGLSTNDYTTTEKNKLAGIEAQANKTVVDNALSASSPNPVQNAVVTAALDEQNSSLVAITSRVSQAETDIDTQSERIDNIIALPSGSTTGDAELMDIRVQTDGTTAASAGSAVRSQVADLHTNMMQKVDALGNDVEILISNAFDNESFTRGKYIGYNQQDQEEYIDNADFCYSDYIEIDNCIISATGHIGNNSISFYNSNKELIEHGGLNSYINVDLSTYAKYCRFNFSTAQIGSVVFELHKKIKCIKSEQVEGINQLIESLTTTSGDAVTSSNYAQKFSDANTITHNKIYSVRFAPTSGQIANLPEYGKNFFFIDVTDKQDSVTLTQIYVRNDGTKMFIRLKWGSEWTDWQNVYSSDDNLKNIDWSSVSMFEKIGVVGDSFASGEIYVNGTGEDYYNLSWIQILARKEGITAHNFSQGGLTTRSWLVEPRGLTLLQNTEKCGLYFLNLGINDSGKMGYDYLGSPSDMHEDYLTNPDTFYGNYGKIIGYIKDKAPHAKLIMCSMPYNDDAHRRAYNGAIAAIAEHFSIPLIVSYELDYFKSDYFQNGLISGHPTAAMYAGMANAYNKAFGDVSVTYKTYFDDYIGIQ